MTRAQLDPALVKALDGLGLAQRRLDAAVVLGSGLDSGAGAVEVEIEADYSSLPGMGDCTVPGHSGILKAGNFGSLRVALFSGRRHFYEHGSMRDAAMPARIASHLGARLLLTLSAVGGALQSTPVGAWVFVDDHINLMGVNPLLGVSGQGASPFVDLTSVYRRDLLETISARLPGGMTIRRGVLAAFSGPTYETPSEVEFARRMGASIVGMSTVPEAVWAKYLGMDVISWGRVSNLAAGLSSKPLRHEDVLMNAAASSNEPEAVVRESIRAWAGAL